MTYFSERDKGLDGRKTSEITLPAWKGFVAAMEGWIQRNYFANTFSELSPLETFGGGGVNVTTGTDNVLLASAIRATFPSLDWPLNPDRVPSTHDALDLVEFCFQKIARPSKNPDVIDLDLLEFDEAKGRTEFREQVNQIFGRNGLAFTLKDNGEVVRLAPAVLAEALDSAVFKTGDRQLDTLLETARQKFLSPDSTARQESLEKLWDAWERLKTLEPGKDKKESVTRLLEKASKEPNFRQLLEEEAQTSRYSLTNIGNNFMIRHTERGKTPIESEEHVDYLFHRMFAMIRLLLRCSDRGG